MLLSGQNWSSLWICKPRRGSVSSFYCPHDDRCQKNLGKEISVVITKTPKLCLGLELCTIVTSNKS